jgi:hypothetical protein
VDIFFDTTVLVAASEESHAHFSASQGGDALLLRCAAKCAAERIYTFNLGDFRQLAVPSLQSKICAP